MKQKNLIILSVTKTICIPILSITALTIYNQDKTNNYSNSSNNTVNVSLNEPTMLIINILKITKN